MGATRWVAAGGACGSLVGVASAGVTFQSMGFLGSGGASTVTEAYDVSSDGVWAVGRGAGSRAFRWSEATGIQPLGAGAGNTNPVSALIWGVANGGSVAVGSRQIGSGSPFPVRWTFASGMQDLGDLPGGQNFGRANEVSDDGNVVVGYSHSTLGPEAFRWTPSQGLVGLGRMPGHNYSMATDVSGDGTRIVGFSTLTGLWDTDTTPCVWMEGGGLQPLAEPGVPGAYNAYPNDISSNGRFIAGHVQGRATDEQQQAIVWNPDGTFTLLGTLSPAGSGSSANGVSDQGWVVGGSSTATALSEAFLWTPGTGMRRIKEILTDEYGLNLDGWSLSWASGISGDGRTIVGSGRDPQGRFAAWVAVIPSPGGAAVLGSAAALGARRRRSS